MHNFLANAARAQRRLAVKAARSGLSANEYLQGDRATATPKGHSQKRYSAVLRTLAPAPEDLRRRTRRRLDDWPLQALPGHGVGRAFTVPQGVSKFTPPRVWTAVFRVI